MIINKYLLKKIYISTFITISVISTVFFLFSLLSNLGENYEFKDIIYLSFFSALQIFIYIPTFILLVIVAVFTINLKSTGELNIILHYTSKLKILSIFIFLILINIFLEINKNQINQKIENLKANIFKSDNDLDLNILIKINNFSKEYLIIKKNMIGEKIAVNFKMINNNFSEANYSNNLSIVENNYLSKDNFKLLGNEIIHNNTDIVFLKNIDKYFINNQINYSVTNKKISFNLTYLKIFIQLFFLIVIVILSFLNKDFINKTERETKIFISNFLLLFYFYFTMNAKFSSFQLFFEILTFGLLIFYFLKKTIYEKYI